MIGGTNKGKSYSIKEFLPWLGKSSSGSEHTTSLALEKILTPSFCAEKKIAILVLKLDPTQVNMKEV
jgi:hypothetical protein